MTHLDARLADNVHYATDPRIRHLAEATWRMRTGGSRMDWLCLGKDNPEALIAEAREWVRAAVAGGILPPPQDDPAWEQAAWKAANADDARTRTVAYRTTDRHGALLCREHGLGRLHMVPLTSEDLPDGGICTWHDCGVDVLIDAD